MELVATAPVNGAENLALSTVVDITFDEEIDLRSAVKGGVILVTSASKLSNRGPGFEQFDAETKAAYNSMNFTGLVECKVSSEDLLTLRLTPKVNLEPNRTYTVLAGTKISAKTIEQPVADEANTGTGDIVSFGSYTGSDDSFLIEIVSAGSLGTARFSITRTSDDHTFPSPVTTDRNVLIENGLMLRFLAGNYEIGDTWEVQVYEPVFLEAINEFSFTTGAGTFVEVPVETQSVNITRAEISGLHQLDGVPSFGDSNFALLETNPENRATAVSLNTKSITLTFSKELDPDRIDEAMIKVLMESLPIDTEMMNSVELAVARKVDGNKLILTFIG